MASLSANLSFPTLLHYLCRLFLSVFGMLPHEDDIEEADNVGDDVEEASPSPSPSPSDDMQKISDVVKLKWKYITYAFSLFVISFSFFGLYFHWPHLLSNFLLFIICFSLFSTLLTALFSLIYLSISKEEKLIKSDGVSRCPAQMCLFFIFVFLTATAFVAVAVNAIATFTGAHNKG